MTIPLGEGSLAGHVFNIVRVSRHDEGLTKLEWLWHADRHDPGVEEAISILTLPTRYVEQHSGIWPLRLLDETGHEYPWDGSTYGISPGRIQSNAFFRTAYEHLLRRLTLEILGERIPLDMKR